MATWMPFYYHSPDDGAKVDPAKAFVMSNPATGEFTAPGAKTSEFVQSLALQIPDFAFTVEVDILGNHRVTVHFKGADVTVDAMA